MVDILDSLGELEGHEFTHAGQTYTVVTVTANRTPLDARDDETPIHLHFTVTTPGRQAPRGLELRLSTERARDLAWIRRHSNNASHPSSTLNRRPARRLSSRRS